MSNRMGDQQLALALRLEGVTGAASEEVERLVAVADMVAALPDPEIDPVFAAKLEQRLLTEGLAEQAAETPESYQGLRVVREAPKPAPVREEKAAPNVVTLPRRRHVVRKTLVAAIAAALAMSLPVAMSWKSLPGSPGYALVEARRALQLDMAKGTDKAFTMAHHAREYLGEAAQLIEIKAAPGLVEATLSKAKRLQADAATIIIRSGSTAAIAKLRLVLERDGDTLRTLLPAAHLSRPALVGAIVHVEDLSKALAAAMGIVLADGTGSAPRTEAIAAAIEASSASSSRPAPGSGEKVAGPRTNDTRPPSLDEREGGKRKDATAGSCQNIGSGGVDGRYGDEIGEALRPVSEQLCQSSNNNAAQ